MRSPLVLVFCGLLALPVALRAQDAPRDIVTTAASVEGFSTLVAAVKAAQLDGALKSKGPFTVFAPTDAAFRLLPKGTVQHLLKRNQRAALQSVLKFHVVSGRLTAADLIGRRSLETLNGQRIVLSNENASLRVNGATVRLTDIRCSNGVIHVIDSVLLPESGNIAKVASKAGSFQTLLAAAKAADLVPALTGKGPLTVFAPTDAAFRKLPKGTVETLLKPENQATLQAILKYHVVSGRIDAATAVRAGRAKTLEGTEVEIGFRDGALRVAEARIVATDIAASNGVIHVIDSVILPPSDEVKSERAVMRVIEDAIDRGAPRFNDGDVAGCVAIYATAANALIELAGDRISGRERNALRAAVASRKGVREQAWELRRAFDAVYERMASNEAPRATPNRETSRNDTKDTFRPRMEAPLPVGFPKPGPVGRVVIKEYPVYRAARASGGAAFWTLFNHIKKNKIEMTAPVEMTMDDRNGRMVQTDMAFLYERPQQGRSGRDGRVEVLDKKPLKVLSIGIRGPMSKDKVKDAKRAIESRLTDMSWKASGEWRLLGYNSPMVPPAQRFWELQIPVAPTRP